MHIAVILTFISVFLLTAAIYLAVVAATSSPKAALKRRLRRMAVAAEDGTIPDGLRSEILRETPPLDRILGRFPLGARTERLLDHAGVRMTLANFTLISVILVITAFIIPYVITGKPLVGATAGGIMLCLIVVVLDQLKARRLDRFTRQLPNALGIMSRSLRAGHSLVGAIELVSQEAEQPIRELFRTAYDQQKLGLRITETLTGMTDRIDSVDLRFFVTAVTINMDIGGNLAEVLDKLGETIRERLKVRRQVRVYTAQGRLSGYVLALLPLVAFFLFQAIMPGYEDPLIRERTGNFILAAAFVSQLLGFLSIRRIVNIRI